MVYARGCRPVAGAIRRAEIGEQVCAVTGERRRIGIGVCGIIVHIDVFTHLPTPVACVRDRDRVIRNPGVLRCASGGERAVSAHVVGVDRGVTPAVRRQGRVVPERVRGGVVPGVVYADIERISDVPGACAPRMVHPEVAGGVRKPGRVRRRRRVRRRQYLVRGEVRHQIPVNVVACAHELPDRTILVAIHCCVVPGDRACGCVSNQININWRPGAGRVVHRGCGARMRYDAAHRQPPHRDRTVSVALDHSGVADNPTCDR